MVVLEGAAALLLLSNDEGIVNLYLSCINIQSPLWRWSQFQDWLKVAKPLYPLNRCLSRPSSPFSFLILLLMDRVVVLKSVIAVCQKSNALREAFRAAGVFDVVRALEGMEYDVWKSALNELPEESR